MDDNWNDAVFGNALFANEDSYGFHESESKEISTKKSDISVISQEPRIKTVCNYVPPWKNWIYTYIFCLSYLPR